MAIETVDVPVRSVFDTSTTRTPKTELGKDDFLLLLTEQLKNQDPMNPMDDMQFISQMASFSSLEQMLQMNENIENMVKTDSSSKKMDAMKFLGSTVTAKGPDMEEAVTGVVEMVGFMEDEPYLKVGEYSFTMDEVMIVSPTIYNAGTGSETTA